MTIENKGDFLAEIIFQTSPICICLLVCYCCFEIPSQHVALLGLNFLSHCACLLNPGVTGMQNHAGLKMYCECGIVMRQDACLRQATITCNDE